MTRKDSLFEMKTERSDGGYAKPAETGDELSAS